MKMKFSSEDAGKATEVDMFPCAVWRKDVRSNFILCQFCRCWVHNRLSSFRGKLKKDGNFKFQTCANQ